MAKTIVPSAAAEDGAGMDVPDGPPERVFARRMKRERLRRGWRQEDLADRLALASLDLHPSAIAKMEREPDFEKGIEPRMIRLNEAAVIARVLGKSIDQMITDDDLLDPEDELRQLDDMLTRARQERESATQTVMQIEVRIAELTHRIKDAHNIANARRTERQRAISERKEFAQKRIAEAHFRTEVIVSRVKAVEGLLRGRRQDSTSRNQALRDILEMQGSEAFVIELQNELTDSDYPHGLRPQLAVQYLPRDRELVVECAFPSPDIIPTSVVYRYNNITDEIQSTPRPQEEVAGLFRQLIAQTTLRLLAEGFNLVDESLVSHIVINGHVSTRDRATGRPIRPCLLSVRVSRDDFGSIVVDEVEPVECLGSYLNAVLSPRPLDLEPIQSLVKSDMSEAVYASASKPNDQPEGKTDLLAIEPTEFEQLTRRLFSEIGMDSWVTAASNDSGVDGIAVYDDPIAGGLCVIQAKRYTRPVGLETVQALAGIVEDKRAAKGLLVTTSWVGKAGHDFAGRNGRIQIIEGVQLKALLRKHLGVEAQIRLPRVPSHWHRDDLL